MPLEPPVTPPGSSVGQVIDQLAELTGFRDRDMVDSTLVAALRDLLMPEHVAIYRCVGTAAEQRWLTRARQARDEAAPSADPGWIELSSLPLLAAFPERLQALEQQEVVAMAGPPWRTVFPLMTDHGAVGVLEVHSQQALDLSERRMVGSILRVYRNFQALLDYSERDTLTGLLNRKTFDESFYRLAARTLAGLEEEDQRSEGERRAAAGSLQHYVGVIDIDHFKSVNDRFGHLIGDEVLLLLSRLMRSCFRFDDHLYRFGGEEFVVLMRCRSDADAGGAFERLRTTVRAHMFPQVGQVTISMGYTKVHMGDSPNIAFDRADKAVYWAKSHGRDQVCSHALLVASGLLEDQKNVGDVELF